jgi:hypothetical protein
LHTAVLEDAVLAVVYRQAGRRTLDVSAERSHRI